MKRMITTICILLAISVMFCGCGFSRSGTGGDSGRDVSGSDLATSNDILDVAYYTVPEEYVVAEDHSDPRKVFYIHKDETAEIPDNISIEVGTNDYSLDDHESFCQAIMHQLAMQVDDAAQIQGSGSTTKQGEILYTFTLTGDGGVTTQYYLVGNERFCLVHESNYTQSEDLDNAANTIVNSFKWKTE